MAEAKEKSKAEREKSKAKRDLKALFQAQEQGGDIGTWDPFEVHLSEGEAEDYSDVVIDRPLEITDSKLPAGWEPATGDDLVIEDPSIAKREKIAKHERDIKRQASIPAYMIRNTAYLAGGVLEGISSPFESLAMSLSSRREISKLLDTLERDDVTWAQRQTVIDRIGELEKLHLEDDHFYRSYRNMENDLSKRLTGNTRAINAIDDATNLSRMMPMLFTEMAKAAINENPQAARQMGLLLSRDGVASTLSLMNPSKFFDNMQAMPFSTLLSWVPIARIISKSPAALARLEQKYKARFNDALGDLAALDQEVRKLAQAEAFNKAWSGTAQAPDGTIPVARGYEMYLQSLADDTAAGGRAGDLLRAGGEKGQAARAAVAETPLVPESVLATQVGGALGSRAGDTIRIGETPRRGARVAGVDDIELQETISVIERHKNLEAGHPHKMGKREMAKWERRRDRLIAKQSRVSPLRPGDKPKTLGSLAKGAIRGAKVGFLGGIPVEGALISAAAHILWPNTPMTRSLERAIGQWIRHTSAQTGASQELAVRAMMVLPAEKAALVRSAVDQIDNIFKAEDALRRRGGDEAGTAASKAAVEVFDYDPKGKELLPSRVAAKDVIAKADELERLLQDENFLRTHTVAEKKQAIRAVARMRELTQSNASGNIAFSATMDDVLRKMDTYLDEAGLSESVKGNMRSRIADASTRTSVLLQDGELSRAVAKRLIDQGIDSTAALEFISEIAGSPYQHGKRRDVRIKGPNGKLINLDNEVAAALEAFPVITQNRVIGAVASHEAARYQKLISSAAHGRAMRNEASKGGILERILNRNLEEGQPKRSIFSSSPDEYAEVLARSLVRKDLGDRTIRVARGHEFQSGGMAVPMVVPGSAGMALPDLKSLRNAIRVLPDEKLAKIMADELGSPPSAVELRNFRKSLQTVSDDLRDYKLVSADELAHENVQRLMDAGVTDPDLLKLAKEADMPSVYIAEGLESTYKWHRNWGGPGKGVAHGLTQMFKGNQTVRSPIGHMHNITGNLGLMLVRWGEDPATFAIHAAREAAFYQNYKHGTLPKLDTLTRGTPDYRNNRAIRLMDQSGVVGKDFVAAELLKMSRSGALSPQASRGVRAFLGRLEDLPGGKATIDRLKKFDEGASKAYGWEDNLPKLRFGMESARRLLKDFDDLSPNTPIRFPTSPVSTTTLVKGADGRLYKGKKALTDAEVDRLVSAYVKRQVDELFLNYAETSGLNKVVSNSPGLAAIAPYFTFNHKAMGFGGTKGFLQNVLEATDGIQTLDPKIMISQIKDAAKIAARRAVLVNSFKQFSSREEDYIARQLAFNKTFPSAVVFDMVSEDPNMLQYRDLVGMSAFAPAEMRLRATAWMVGNLVKSFGGYDKGKKSGGIRRAAGFSDKEAEQFVKDLQHGDIGSVWLLAAIMGAGRGPLSSIIEAAQSKNPKLKKVLDAGLPVVLPPPLQLPIRELIAHARPDWEVFSGKRISKHDPELNERWEEYLARRLLKKGARKIRIFNTNRTGNLNLETFEKQMTNRMNENYKNMKDSLERQASLAEGKILALSKRWDKLTDAEKKEADKQLEQWSSAVERIGSWKKDSKGKVIENSGLLGKIGTMKQEEQDKLIKALLFTEKVRRLRGERFGGGTKQPIGVHGPAYGMPREERE